jgi:cell fate (sporulation/competence/biofilm development) regulator YlbF (YheA/YmcA/DUF963 family)
MLHAVLQMPPDCWQGDEIDVCQRYSFYLRASRELTDKDNQIRALTDKVNRLEELIQTISAITTGAIDEGI